VKSPHIVLFCGSLVAVPAYSQTSIAPYSPFCSSMDSTSNDTPYFAEVSAFFADKRSSDLDREL